MEACWAGEGLRGRVLTVVSFCCDDLTSVTGMIALRGLNVSAWLWVFFNTCFATTGVADNLSGFMKGKFVDRVVQFGG